MQVPMGRPLTAIDLKIPYFAQETPLWCWAAVSQMIIEHFKGPDGTPEQKEIVRMALGQPHDERWQAGIPKAAVVPNDDHFIALIVKVLSRRASEWYPPCAAEEIYANLYFGNPVILHLRVGADSSHVVVVAGIRPAATGGFEVLLNDPAPNIPGPFWTPFEAIAPAIIQHMIVYRDIKL
jgi:Papain-like cysteine protease AvrRpt2